MKLGVFSLSYSKMAEQGMSSLEMVDMAKQQGFVAFEPYPFGDLQTVDAALKLGKKVREAGMVLSCFSTDVELIGPKASENVERMKLYIEMAKAMGSPYFHHTIHPQIEVTAADTVVFHDAVSEVVPRLKELCLYAEERGVTCLYEEQGLIFNGVAPIRRLAEEMRDVPYGLVLDSGNILFVDEKPEEYLGVFANKIKHFHLKDYYLKSGNQNDPGEGWLVTRRGDYLRDAIPGHGAVNYMQLMRMIHRIGYDGYFSLEYCGPESHDYAIEQSVQNITNYYELSK